MKRYSKNHSRHSTVSMALTAYRRGQTIYWFFIYLFFYKLLNRLCLIDFTVNNCLCIFKLCIIHIIYYIAYVNKLNKIRAFYKGLRSLSFSFFLCLCPPRVRICALTIRRWVFFIKYYNNYCWNRTNLTFLRFFFNTFFYVLWKTLVA